MPVGDVINMRAAVCRRLGVIRSRNVIGHVTIRLSIDDFLYTSSIEIKPLLSSQSKTTRYLPSVRHYLAS